MRLYIVYLGGPCLPGRMGEDHEVVTVVAEDVPHARISAKAKWQGCGAPHVDSVVELLRVDGYRINLEPCTVQERNAIAGYEP